MANVERLLSFCLRFLFLLCPSVFCFMDMDELKSVYYGLDIVSEPVAITQDIPVGAVHVTSKYGQQYQCTFPNLSLDEKRKEEEEKLAIETGIVEMLKPMGLNDCLFKSKDWWSYEFCYGKYIRQFHMEDGEIKGNIIYLGYFHEDFDWNNETSREDRVKSKSALNRYHSQYYTLGTKCDLTDQMRKAEIRFMCEENSEDYLSRVDESETCVYTVTVMTSRICRHPYLKAPAKRRSVPITCNPLLSPDEFQDYTQEREEKRKKEEALKTAAKDALSKDGALKLSDWDLELSKTLENEMSTAAKELLANQLLRVDSESSLSKEDFQKQQGSEQSSLKVQQKGMKQNLQEMMNSESEVTGLQKGETGVKEMNVVDEDDEILSQFDKEISTIKAKFQSSQSKLSNIKKKLSIERHWESEIENAIKEAEEELGVKVDRSLISGLSNTLDKLVNKLHDTERELSSMDKEIGKLKPGKKILRNDGKELDDNADKNDDDNDGTVAVEEDEADSIDADSDDVVANRHDMVGEVKSSYAHDQGLDLHDKIQAPPKLGLQTHGSEDAIENEEAEDHVEETKEGSHEATDDGTSDIDITVKNVESSMELPKDVQKLLEESVLKGLQKHRQQTDSQALSFDSDHSINRDKTVHIFQQEDEDGKTNRFVLVFGFNTFTDEAAEKEKQSSLEQNYNFVYDRKKDKRSINA
ncbi:hypothetical protein BsWGS_09491 [Bradybaena similaris]